MRNNVMPLVPRGDTHYKLLVDMAAFMSDFDNPRAEFKEHVHRLVQKCLEGTGTFDAGEKQMHVFGLLNRVYTTAAAWREQDRMVTLTTRLTNGMVKESETKRRRVANDHGRPSF